MEQLSAGIEKSFEKDTRASEHRRVYIILVVGGILYPLHGILDRFLYPDRLPDLVVVRLGVTTCLFACLVSLHWFKSLRQSFWITGIAFLSASYGAAAMVWLTDQSRSPYYAGIVLFVFLVSVLFTWPTALALALYSLSILGYLAAVFANPNPIDGRLLFNNLSFLLSTVAIAVIGSNIRLRLALKEFMSRVTLEESHRQLESISRRDPLTKLFNRRTLNEKLEEIISLNKRYGAPSTVLLIDLDNFKSVNDLLGHRAGDEFLKATAALLVAHTRDTDLVYRIGGDEFLILLQNQTLENSRPVVQRLEKAFLGYCATPRLREAEAGASLGVFQISYREGVLETPAHVFEAVDHLLYEKKREKKARPHRAHVSHDAPPR